MTYFRINLNKLEDPDLVVKRLWKRNGVFVALAVVAGLILASVVHMNRVLGQKQRDLRSMSRGIEQQISELEASVSHISEDDVRELSDLNDRRVFWAGKLEALADLTGNDIAITGLRYDGRALSITGITRAAERESRFSLISSFIERLKADPAFSRDFGAIEFVSSSKTDVMGMNVLNFELLCYQP